VFSGGSVAQFTVFGDGDEVMQVLQLLFLGHIGSESTLSAKPLHRTYLPPAKIVTVHRILVWAALLVSLRPLMADTAVVLPLFNYTKSSSLDWIGESVAKRVRESLASEGLLLASREDRTEVYHRLSIRPNVVLTRATIFKIGQSLDASQVVFGQFELTPAAGTDPQAALHGTLRLTGFLIDLKHMRLGPTFTAEGPMTDLSVLQTRVAWLVLHYLSPKLPITEAEFMRALPPVRVDALESYIRGLLSSSDDVKIKLFTQATKIDDHYSEPAFQLGRLYFRKKAYRDSSLWFSKVASTDSHYMEAMFFLGLCRFYQGDYESAIKQFQTVADSVPLNEVFNNLGAAESRLDKPDATDSFKKALEGDEADPDYWFNVGLMLWKQGKFAEAKEKFTAVLERNPQDQEASDMLGRSMRLEGAKASTPSPKERVKSTFEQAMFLQLKAALKEK
jgi:Tfp pilus assembly protein PilF